MEFLDDPWLAAILARPVFRVSLREDETPSVESLREHAGRHSAATYYAKIATSSLSQVRSLSAAGFYVVDVNVTLSLKPPWPSPMVTIPVSPARPEEERSLLEIAGRCFTCSRFHLDPLIPRPTADRIKREWLASYLRGKRGERLHAARLGPSAAGFLAVLGVPSPGGTVRVIDLMGVDPPVQGRGVGRSLVAHFIREEGPRSVRLEVGTQAANTRSLRLYEAMGFRTERTQYVLHRHVPDGPLSA
ncbi:MAG TPA: GNAT family N-acetyltransferase [Planctomycetota bacterium]|nr:GNAT family N-acetyltransferase [Planctomycetota bacterium]